MQSFSYYAPTEIIFGKDTEMQVADEIKKYGGSRVYLIYGGGSAVKSGLIGRVEKCLADAGLAYKTKGGVQPNPRVEFAKEAATEAKTFGADFILAVGGGSVIDTCKAVAHSVANPTLDLWEDIWLQKVTIEKSLPIASVLTISAAGSETSDSAVLTNEALGVKRGINIRLNRPKFAIMNPELTYTLPKFQIACGVVDIMMHTLDRYFTNTTGNEMTDALAEALLRVVIQNGPAALDNPHDYEPMSELMWCGSLSHNGLTGLGAVADFAPHQLGHELSATFDVAHGASLSAVWGSWATYCLPVNPERFARFGREVWGIDLGDAKKTGFAAIEKTVQYFASLNMPINFTTLGIGVQNEVSLNGLAERCVYFGARKVGHFKELDQKDVYEIYKMANV